MKAFLPLLLFIHFLNDGRPKRQKAVVVRDFRLAIKESHGSGGQSLEQILLTEPDSPDFSRTVFEVRLNHRNPKIPQSFLPDVPDPCHKSGRFSRDKLPNRWSGPTVFVPKRKTVEEIEDGPIPCQFQFFGSLLPDIGNDMQGRDERENGLIHQYSPDPFIHVYSKIIASGIPELSLREAIDFECVSL
jgi:hypothetical protein